VDTALVKGQADSRGPRRKRKGWRSSDQIHLNKNSIKEVCHPKDSKVTKAIGEIVKVRIWGVFPFCILPCLGCSQMCGGESTGVLGARKF